MLVVSNGYPTAKYPLNGIFAYDQTKALDLIGVKVVLACIDLRSIRRMRRFGYVHEVKDGIDIFSLSIPIGRIPTKILLTLGKFFFNKLYNKIVELKGKPRLIHAHFYHNAYIALDVKKKDNLPFVITEHSSLLLNKKIPAAILDVCNKCYSEADAVLAVSRQLAHRLYLEFSIKAKVIHNIADVESFRYTPQSNAKDYTNFLTVGNLIKRKGMDILFRAFSKLSETNPTIRLVVVGDGPERTNLENLKLTLGVNERVVMRGQLTRSEMIPLFSSSDYFVLASRNETFGVVYIEAMAAGLPVIATRCGGPESFINEECGVLVPVDDVDMLAEAMSKMLGRDYDREKISINTKLTFSPCKIAKDIIDVYQTVLYEKYK